MHTSLHRWALAALALAAFFAFGSGIAQAAPQALALVATKGKVSLTCEGAECSAELTAFCLQPDRFSPVRGTPYHLANLDQVRVTGTTRDGREISLDPARFLRIESARTHVAVRVSAPQAKLEALDLAKVEIAVGENVALLPEPVPGDPRPLTESETALLTGPLRVLGSRIVDSNQDRMAAARATNRMINMLPARGGRGAVTGPELWQRAVATSGGAVLTPGAERRVRRAQELCQFMVNRRASSLRRCLQEQHDGFIDFLNSDYWEAVKTGS